MASLSYSDTSLNNYDVGEPLLGPDKDTVKFSASSDAVSQIIGNTIESGDGGDTIDFKIKSKVEAYGSDNIIDAGDGPNKVKFDFSGDSYARASYNTLLSLDGDDKIDFKVKSKEYNYVSVNAINAGDGKNQLKIDVSSKSGPTIFKSSDFATGTGDDKIHLNINAGETSEVTGNSINAGDGKNDVKIDVRADVAEIFGNSISGGNGDDDFSFKAKSGKAETLFEDNTDFNSNVIIAGDGENQLKVDLSGKVAKIDALSNSFTGGAGADVVELKLKSKERAEIEDNTINAGDGENEVSFQLSAKETTYIYTNEITSGSGDDVVKFDLKPEDFYVVGNTISAGDGENEISINGNGKGFSSTNQNVITTGSGDDLFSTKLKGREADFNGNDVSTGNGDDTILVDAKVSGSVNSSGNSIHSGDGNDNVEVTNISKTRNATFRDSEIIGGNGEDHIVIEVEGKKGLTRAADNTIRAGDSNDLDSGSTVVTYYDAALQTDVSYIGSFNDISLSATGESVYLQQNLIYGSTSTDGSGRSVSNLSLSGESKTFLRAEGNLLQGGDDLFAGSLNLDLEGGDGVHNITGNTLQSGDGVTLHSLSIDLEYTAGTTVSGNAMLGGDAFDTFDLVKLEGLTLNKESNAQAFLDNNTIDGGAGSDSLSLSLKDQTIDFSTTNVTGIDKITVSGKGNSLILSDTDIINLSDAGNLFIFGNNKTTVDIGGALTFSSSDANFNIYTGGGASLYVETGISVV